MTGKTLKNLMRTNKVTIRELAARLDMPMTRVRFRRQHGFTNRFAASDWIFAITGKRPDPYPHFRG